MSANHNNNDFEYSEQDRSNLELFETGNDNDIIREQDRLLPIANVARIMKQAVPTNAKIAKDAKDTVQACVSEFISFVTSE
jgi:histone H3/H4